MVALEADEAFSIDEPTKGTEKVGSHDFKFVSRACAEI